MAFTKLNSMKFIGLDGLSHFWSKAKTWIINRITTEVTAKIAEIVANAPEDLDTLKEIADWISAHANDAAAMNTAISTNTSDIATLKTTVAGKSDTGHTHTKSQITDFPTSLPANGGTATKATQDGNGNVITSTYVKKSGDTLTGPIVMKANQYTLETAQLDMKNSDIKGANAIWFDDHAEVGEGLKFPRSSGSNYDFMRLDDGKIKVAPNVTVNANTATESIVAYTSDIQTSLPANGGTADKATSVVDYGDTSRTIKIGYAGAGATVDNLSYIAGYLTDGSRIKNVSKATLTSWLGLSNYLPLSGGTVTGATQFNNYVKLNAWDGYGTGTANLWYDGNNKFVEIQNATDLKLSGFNVSKEGHTHTKSEITDFPTSLPANGGTATKATQDGSGNNIASTYMPKSGGTFIGSVEFDQPTYFNDEIHSSCLFPKNSIDSFFSFFKDTTDNYLPRVYGYNCGDVFNNDMCLRYYKCNYTSMSVALNNLNQLKKLFASMYPYETDGCARCTSIHVTINVSFTDGKPAIIGDIINYGYCNSDDIARVNKDGSVYVGEDFYSNYHVLYISYDDGFKEKDAYYLANEILKNGMRHINHFSFIGNYVLAEHL